MTGTLKIRCPNLLCRTILSVPPDMRGQCVHCQECNHPFVVPLAPQGKKPRISASAELANNPK